VQHGYFLAMIQAIPEENFRLLNLAAQPGGKKVTSHDRRNCFHLRMAASKLFFRRLMQKRRHFDFKRHEINYFRQ
jgi:hypothetical protein